MRVRIFNRTLLLFIIQAILAFPAAALAKDEPSGKKNKDAAAKPAAARKAKRKKQQTLPAEARRGGPQRRLWFYASLSSLFDSNIDHDEENVRSFGLVPSVGVHFQSSLERPSFQLDYETAYHSYTNTARWDRTSHKARASYERRLSRWLSSETVGELTIRGSAEDRELNNQFVLGQEFELRASRSRRFKVFAAYRLKRYSDDPGRNAINPYVGAAFEQRFAGGRSLEVSYRYDKNRSENPRNRYVRWTYGAEFKTPFLRRDALLTIEARYRPQLYARIIEIEDEDGDDEDVTRRDRRWIVGASWQRPLNDSLALGLGYRFEARRSNDVERNFNSHLAGVTLTYRWWK